MAEPPNPRRKPSRSTPWWTPAYRVRRVVFAIVCKLGVATVWVLAIAALEWVLDISRVGDHVLFRNAVEGAAWWHYGLRVSALFDLLHFTVILNFIYRSARHWNRTYREDDE